MKENVYHHGEARRPAGSGHKHAYRRHHYSWHDEDVREEGNGHKHNGRKERLERGMLRYLLLEALRHSAMHGYEMIKWFEERTYGKYSPSPGTVYPTLQLLQDQGFIQAQKQVERSVYSLTENGRSELATHANLIADFWERYARPAPSYATLPEVSFLREELSDLNRVVEQGWPCAIQHDNPEAILQMRHALEGCQNEIRSIISQCSASHAATPSEVQE
ncbi:PadR family transcriptional regulator [Dictyobacter formicarum]|nr:PadR family transcriptional regulator [Dictyobacter formicarum]